MLIRILLSFFLFNSLFLFSQEKEISGIIKNSANETLSNVSIIAFPLDNIGPSKFAISNNNGAYRLLLKKNKTYAIELSHLGYSTIKDTLRLAENSIKNFYLDFVAEQLDEVIITNKASIKILGDTISYRPKKFINGTERKLKDVLKKLPGIHVDNSGNVTVNNKEVTKLLIDGKEFLTGDEKMGVNKIPSDVIFEIEAIDNYNKVSFLKGLNESQQLALNIKLKKNKKKFTFGEIAIGGGNKYRHLLQPTLFFYSPKTNISFITDINSLGEKSFTIEDYVNFEGGFNRFGNDPSAYVKLFNSDFSEFLSQKNFTSNQNYFGALSINHKLSKNIEAIGYSIFSKDNTNTRQENTISYLLNENLNEIRNTTKNNRFLFSLNKASLRYIGEKNLDIEYESFFKINTGKSRILFESITLENLTFSNQNNRSSLLDFTHSLSINKQYTPAHTTSINFSHNYVNERNNGVWKFSQPIFLGILPIQKNDEEIDLLHRKQNDGSDFQFNLKHYWILHRLHHVYPEIGVHYTNQKYNTEDAQKVNNRIINFDEGGFNNNLDYKLYDTYAGLNYKVKVGKLTFKPGIFYHKYNWNIKQFKEELRNSEKHILLPELSVDWKLSGSHKLNLQYNFNSNFGAAGQFINRFSLISFNQVYKGNLDIENELSHNIQLGYNKFSIFKGYFFNANFSYNKKVKSIRNNTITDGINQINTLFYTSLPEDLYRLNFSYSKKVGAHKLRFNGTSSLSNYSRKINEIKQDFNSQLYSYDINAKIKLKKASNLEIGWDQSFNILNSTNNNTGFTQIKPYASLEYYFSKNFIYNLDCNFTYYENKSQQEINRFFFANSFIAYKKESSSWTFSLNTYNLFNTNFLQKNSFNQFLANDLRTFIQDRTVLAKIEHSF